MARRWRVLPGYSLQARLLSFMALRTVLGLATLGGLGYLAAQQTVDRSLEERQVLARITGVHLEAILQQNLRYLVDFGGPAVDLNDAELGPEREALRDLYFQSIFDDQVFLLNSEGRLLLSELQETGQGEEDFLGLAYVQRAMRDERLTVSSVHYREPGRRPVVSAVAPLRDRAGTPRVSRIPSTESGCSARKNPLCQTESRPQLWPDVRPRTSPSLRGPQKPGTTVPASNPAPLTTNLVILLIL